MGADTSRISVIIPVHNGARTLPRVIDALTAALPAPHEIIAVDDASTDGSGEIAAHRNCRVLRLEHNCGAARAKNRGAAQAQGEVLFFTDADIVVPSDIFARLANAFADANLDGVVGVLDAHIPARDFASQYKNFWMHFTYARLAHAARVGLFYTSAAAMRRDVFLKHGGFDENYRGASIAEDTEFGQRAWANGVILRLDAQLAVVHLKTYTPLAVLREDYARARALTLLRLRKWGQPFFTSVPFFYQLGVPTLALALLGFALMPFIGSMGIMALGALVAFYLLNAPWLTFLARQRGIGFGAQGALFLPFDAFAVGLGTCAALFDCTRGRKY